MSNPGLSAGGGVMVAAGRLRFDFGTLRVRVPRALAIFSEVMPIYEYRCKNGHTFEVMQRMSDPPVTECEVDGAPVQRVFHPVAVHFKGSGFYNTDYGTRKRSREKEAAKGESKSESSSSGSSDAKSGSDGSTNSGSGAKKAETKASAGD
jgi:putative FmdB family regulatory protein